MIRNKKFCKHQKDDTFLCTHRLLLGWECELVEFTFTNSWLRITNLFNILGFHFNRNFNKFINIEVLR